MSEFFAAKELREHYLADFGAWSGTLVVIRDKAGQVVSAGRLTGWKVKATIPGFCEVYSITQEGSEQSVDYDPTHVIELLP
ncbi:hypothetical protein [Mycobacteroides abscessus]|uniref:hypothetical protein n=1 Tax=Mycobacteroides abscessus TaxID=36809 RepID=UPI0009A752E3|nr:hypothetical protein [Mycobacteroides abscessus]SLH40891.1 Uncharacterised protein [Mycobacteroides abscessus subsp. massiliense]